MKFKLIYLGVIKTKEKNLFLCKVLDNNGNVINMFVTEEEYNLLYELLDNDVSELISFRYFEKIVNDFKVYGYLPYFNIKN